ncbi:MAG: DUF4861 domain-containing protein [Tannerella sp.]|jgi:hypothetical protein|nr:DUF4861 domain-containing protein [Tannerella sp.]
MIEKSRAFLLWSAVALISCVPGKTLRLTVENPSDFDRSAEIVEIPVSDLTAKIALGEGQTFVLANENQEILPTQITYDGKLIFQAGTKAGESVTYTLSAGTPQTFPPKTYGRFITERKDDFAWENDRVAFRIYGPALVEIDGPSNGLDFWYKRTADLIIDKWYGDDLAGVRSYHEDHGEGLDDYKVGRTLGGGMMAPYVDRKLWLNDNFVRQEVFENGPLRTTFRLTYKDMDVAGKTFGESRTFSLDAGSQLTKVIQAYGTDEVIPVAAGIVKRPGNDAILKNVTAHGTATLIYAEPTGETVGNVYVGTVFPSGLEQTVVDTYTLIHPKTGKEETHSHVLGITSCRPDTPVTYYTGYGWSKSGFPAVNDFQALIAQFAASLERPLIVIY